MIETIGLKVYEADEMYNFSLPFCCQGNIFVYLLSASALTDHPTGNTKGPIDVVKFELQIELPKV